MAWQATDVALARSRQDAVAQPQQGHTVTLLPPDQTTLPLDLRLAWERLDAENSHVYAMYQSALWWDHLQATGQGAQARVAVVRDAHGKLAAIVPFQLRDHPLGFNLGRRWGVQLPVRAACILGGEPFMPGGASLCAQLLKSIWAAVPEVDAIYLKGVSTAGRTWEHLQHGCAQAIVYAESGVRGFYTINLPRTFEAYLSKFKQKKRYNLKRQVKLLRERGGGSLELVRAESVTDIPAFLRDARLAAQRSWQARLHANESDAWDDRVRAEDLARRGFLRSYTLRAGGTPCAYVNGYQVQDVFHYADVGYDKRYAAHSPGAVLLYLLIEDLIKHRPPKVMNFGIGDSHYKSQFATERSEEASVLLLKRTLANNLRYMAHRTYRSLGRQLAHARPGGLFAAPLAAQTLEVLGGACKQLGPSGG